jgi:4'-phosphopantetheinyl transferase
MLAWGQVDIWAAVPEAVAAPALDALAACLSEDERARAAGFALEAARRRFIVTRALLRRALSSYADVTPEGWVFVRDPHGKPGLEGAQATLGPCFNVSHTPGLALCAIARSDVGIDVQDITRPPPAGVGERYLSEIERRALEASPEGQRSERFFERWTLKEAYVKARGLGFALPLAQIGFELSPLGGADATPFDLGVSAASLVLGPGCPDDGRRYWLKAWRASREHRAAVALAQPPDTAAAHVAEASAGPCPLVCLRSDPGLPSLVSPQRP